MPRDALLRQLLVELAELLQRDDVTELCVNGSGSVFFETNEGWTQQRIASLTPERCEMIAKAVATYSHQEVSKTKPILSAMLPQGERIQIVMPPVAETDGASFTIRRPSRDIRTLEKYEEAGAFGRFAWGYSRRLEERLEDLAPLDRRLVGLLRGRNLKEFLRLAVRERKNIAVVGETGSGKTTLMKTLCQSIPANERLLTIEDVRELMLPKHPNRVHLLYSKGDQGAADVSPAQLIASAMRMKPDRVLLAELRGAEAYDYLKLLTTGHAGSITSYHAESGALAPDRYVFMAKEHADAQAYDPPAIKQLVKLTIDVVVMVVAKAIYDENDNVIGKERYVSEITFDPVAKLEAQFGDAKVYRQ
ncbi:MAG: P-type DNA transfer ATPase VirB11 [Lautropia sp.]